VPAAVSPAAEAQPPPAERPRRRRAAWLALAAASTIAALVAWLYLGQHCPADPSAEKGSTVLCKAKLVIVAGVSTALSSCAALMGNVRPGDREFIDKCSPEKRQVLKELNIEHVGLAFLDNGPNVIKHRIGCEVKTGPVEVYPSIGGLEDQGGGKLIGEIRTGPDGASVRFHTLKLHDGREREVCAIGVARGDFYHYGPGIRRFPDDELEREPDSKLHRDQGFIYVIHGALDIILAK
jgi:hypothetical protein